MNKLLHKSMKAVLLYAGIVLACSIPAYYLIVDLIWEHELKEHNRIVSETIKQNLQSLSLTDAELLYSIQLWNRLRPETQLREIPVLKPDSTYNIYRKNKYIPAKGWDRFQGLITCFRVNNKTLRLTIETNMEESHETIIAIAAVTFFFFLILLGGLIYLNRRNSEKLWQPFYSTLHKIQHFELNKLHTVQFEKSSTEEFELLNHYLERLIAANTAVYKQQKEFTQNASHELQTPLSIVKFKLDLLHQTTALTDEQSILINEAHQALSKVTRINKNLLLLAKMEGSQFSDTQPVDLSVLLQDHIGLLDDFIADKQLRLSTHITAGVNVLANKVLLEILITNLLMNAIRHSLPNDYISIKLMQNELEVANSGNAPLVTGTLFTRFGFPSSNTTGTGLGLAIIHQVCLLHDWKKSYHYEKGLHIFRVVWA